MHPRARLVHHALLGAIALGALAEHASAQAVVAAWGNVEGVRVAGEVLPFESSLCLSDSTGAVRARTAKERQRQRCTSRGATRTITTSLGAFTFISPAQ